MDKEAKRLITESLKPLKTIADGIEKLVNEPLVEIETPPPQCPHCAVMNPEVVIESSSGRGKIAEFVLEAHCQNCGKPIFGVVANWNLFTDSTTAFQQGRMILEKWGLNG